MKKIFHAVGLITRVEANLSESLMTEFMGDYRVMLKSSDIRAVHDEVIPSFIDFGSRCRIQTKSNDWYHVRESFEECCDFWSTQSIDFLFNEN